MAQWLSPDDTRLPVWWPGSADLLQEELGAYLDSAAAQCAAFAPDLDLDPDAEVPTPWLHAQALQARALARVGRVGDNSGLSETGQPISLWPMDWTVKALLRPAGKPVIG